MHHIISLRSIIKALDTCSTFVIHWGQSGGTHLERTQKNLESQQLNRRSCLNRQPSARLSGLHLKIKPVTGLLIKGAITMTLSLDKLDVWEDYMARIAKLDWATVQYDEFGDRSAETVKAYNKREQLLADLKGKLDRPDRLVETA